MAANPNSILDSVKQVIGVGSDSTVFDIDVIMQINMAFGILRQVGVGANTGFQITDNTTLWGQYVADIQLLGMVKSYIFMAAKLAFDPPATSFAIDALKSQIAELVWRINVAAEELNPPTDPFLEEEAEAEVASVIKEGVFQVAFSPEIKHLVIPDSDSHAVINAKDANVFYLELTDDCTVNAPVNGTDGQHITLEFACQGYTVTWGTGWNFGDGGTPVLSSDKVDIIGAVYAASTGEWRCGYVSGF